MVCREAKIIRRENEWFVYITVEKEVEERSPHSVLAVDMGIRWIAATVNSNNPKPKFYGKELRKVNGHFFYLRRSLALKKAYKTVKNIGNKERRVVTNILHNISRTIVNEALENNSLIVLGKLKGIRSHDKGKRFNRKLNGFSYHRLSLFVEYKAKWLGITVIKVSERNTSKTCHECGREGIRVGSSFTCPHCNYSCNADYNGAVNILKRGLGYMPSLGAAFDTAQNSPYEQPEFDDEERIPQASAVGVSTINLNGRY